MPHLIKTVAEWAAALLELLGLGIIVALALHALAFAAWMRFRGSGGPTVFRETRIRMIRGILLGLEFLVAADIIHTVALDLTFTGVGVLAIIVLIRTFLSFGLEMEMTGRWPWQQQARE